MDTNLHRCVVEGAGVVDAWLRRCFATEFATVIDRRYSGGLFEAVEKVVGVGFEGVFTGRGVFFVRRRRGGRGGLRARVEEWVLVGVPVGGWVLVGGRIG